MVVLGRSCLQVFFQAELSWLSIMLQMVFAASRLCCMFLYSFRTVTFTFLQSQLCFALVRQEPPVFTGHPNSTKLYLHCALIPACQVCFLRSHGELNSALKYDFSVTAENNKMSGDDLDGEEEFNEYFFSFYKFFIVLLTHL